MDGVLVGCCCFTMAKNNQDWLDLVICGNLWVSGMNPTHPQSLLWWLCWHTWLCDLRNLSVYQMLSSLSRYMWVLCAMAIAISSIRIWHLMYWMLLLCLWCKVVEKLCVVMIPTVVNCCQLCQALSKCFCVFANCEIVSCFAEFGFCNVNLVQKNGFLTQLQSKF